MPLPKPRKNEDRDEFIRRFMDSKQAKKDFPDKDQRIAVAFSKLKKK